MLLISALCVYGLAWVLIRMKAPTLPWALIAAALASLGVVTWGLLYLLLSGEVSEEERIERIASWHCPACGQPYGLESRWTGWAFGGRDLLHVDMSGWSDDARAFHAAGQVTLLCAHCGSKADFLERDGTGVQIPPIRSRWDVM